MPFRREMPSSFFVALMFLLMLCACIDERSKKHLFGTDLICHQLWTEKFRVFSGGAYSAELYSDYLTDSVNFRIFVGTHDEYGSFSYQCVGDKIVVRKFKHTGTDKEQIQAMKFDLSKLQKERKFE